MSTLDHRRATAERNAAAVLDATERLLANGTPLTMSALAAEAGISRPTLYAHYKTVGAAVEAAVERSVAGSLEAIADARLGDGPPDEALARLIAASYDRLALFQPLVQHAREHVEPGAVHRTHQAMMAPVRELIERGVREHVFRDDLPLDWLVSSYFGLVHAGGDHALAHDLRREDALALITRSLLDLFTRHKTPRASQ